VRPYDRKIAIFERGMGPIPDARSVFRLQLAKGADGSQNWVGSAPSGECRLRDQGAHHSPSILSTKRQWSILMFANQVIWGTLANIGL
jgi:hypothetical protein